VLTAARAGRDARLLELAEPGEDRFRHDLVRDAIYDSIPVDAREDLHARAGGVLAGLAGRGRDVDDTEVAYHLARAGTAAEADAAADIERSARIAAERDAPQGRHGPGADVPGPAGRPVPVPAPGDGAGRPDRLPR
jgi:hypothetical protein